MAGRFVDYYTSELEYLTEAGRAFADRHTQIAALLNPGNVRARDPHVERLFENFAFLTAGIRQRLDDELPELCHSLLGLVAPQYARPVPALATVQLQPEFAQLTAPQVIKAGAEVRSRPIEIPGGSPLTCSFETCRPVDLYPIELVEVRQAGGRQDQDELRLVFELREPGQWPSMKLDRIRLFLQGDTPRHAYSLHHHLTEHVTRVEMTPDAAPRARALRIDPVGFSLDEAVIPYESRSLPGYRLLQEYFCFPEKFLYVDIAGLDERMRHLEDARFEVSIWFDRDLPRWWNISAQNFQQFCTPVVNLFDAHADPIDYDHRSSEYAIDVDRAAPDAWHVHEVTSVMGRPHGRAGADSVSYPAFLDFRGYRGDADCYYTVTPRIDSVNRLRSMLSLVQPDGAPAVLPQQVISVDVRAFNGDLPRALQPGDIRHRGDGLSRVVKSITNFAPPTPVRWPPIGDATTWALLSHLAANQVSIADEKALARTLRLYDWVRDEASDRRIEGIRSVDIEDKRATLFRQGVVIQGIDVALALDDSCFTDIGDAYLFSLVLRHFLALHATLNSFVQLKVACDASKRWEWPALDGQQQTL